MKASNLASTSIALAFVSIALSSFSLGLSVGRHLAANDPADRAYKINDKVKILANGRLGVVNDVEIGVAFIDGDGRFVSERMRRDRVEPWGKSE